MIVIPALTGFAVGQGFARALATAIGTALLAMLLGLTAAYYLALAAGGAVVLTALAIFAAVVLTARLRRRGAPR
ncbi:MAG: metal ABC transporter permease, partial [candidate division NC10 bacterium]|nr:metal ABC transporter permease [candidate division NC10 bacterium]